MCIIFEQMNLSLQIVIPWVLSTLYVFTRKTKISLVNTGYYIFCGRDIIQKAVNKWTKITILSLYTELKACHYIIRKE